MTIRHSDIVIKSGAVSSLIGTFILILLVLVLVIFPVQKICNAEENCTYSSSAPGMLKEIVSPQTLVASLLTIAGGIFMFRFGTWYKIRKEKR